MRNFVKGQKVRFKNLETEPRDESFWSSVGVFEGENSLLDGFVFVRLESGQVVTCQLSQLESAEGFSGEAYASCD